MKEKGVISRLFQYMGIFKITMAISFVLAAISAVVNLSAYTCIYNVAKEIVTSHGNFASLDQAYLIELGWRAVFLISAALFPHYGLQYGCKTAHSVDSAYWKPPLGLSLQQSQWQAEKNY